MAIDRSAWANGLVTDYTTSTQGATAELGCEREVIDPTYGSLKYRYVTNGDVIAFTAGNVIQRKSATSTNGTGIVCVTTDAYQGAILGVAVSAIPAGGFGWVQVKGFCSSLVTDGGSASGDALGSKGATTAGSVYTVTKGLGTDFAYACDADVGTAINAILSIS